MLFCTTCFHACGTRKGKRKKVLENIGNASVTRPTTTSQSVRPWEKKRKGGRELGPCAQPPTVACKMEAQLGHAHILCTCFCTYGADLYVQSAHSNKISASELGRKFIKSALRCWLGDNDMQRGPFSVAAQEEEDRGMQRPNVNPLPCPPLLLSRIYSREKLRLGAVREKKRLCFSFP